MSCKTVSYKYEFTNSFTKDRCVKTSAFPARSKPKTLDFYAQKTYLQDFPKTTDKLMGIEAILAVSIFLLVYGLLVWDKLNRAVVSLLGAGLLILLGVLTQEKAIHGIDFNTIGLLVGMMAIVTICQKTGMFQYLAIKSAKLAGGDPWRILLYLSVITAVLSALLDNVTTVLLIAPITLLITAVLSALLDNVTTVLLIAPITLLITDELDITPYPFLTAQILASNIGGAATLIGDPPNIMIGSAVGLSFMDFILNVAPIMPVVMVATFAVLKLIYGKQLQVSVESKERIMQFKEAEALEDPVLLSRSSARRF
jgi:Na+/H+ antiporter NhaD/arsenite permease-like protein